MQWAGPIARLTPDGSGLHRRRGGDSAPGSGAAMSNHQASLSGRVWAQRGPTRRQDGEERGGRTRERERGWGVTEGRSDAGRWSKMAGVPGRARRSGARLAANQETDGRRAPGWPSASESFLFFYSMLAHGCACACLRVHRQWRNGGRAARRMNGIEGVMQAPGMFVPRRLSASCARAARPRPRAPRGTSTQTAGTVRHPPGTGRQLRPLRE